MKTIKELANMSERVYVHLNDEETAMRFLRQAESEGFTFGDGVSPTDRHWSDLYAIHLLNDELITKALRCRNQRAHEIIVSDIEEIKKCFEAKAFKATLIMAGSVLEAFLIDWLSELKKKDYFLTKYLIEDVRGKRPANLADYINIIDDIKKPDWMKEAEKAHEIREQRNKVHAKLCLNDEEKIDAKLCEKVIKCLSQIIKTRYETDLDSKRKAS